MSEAPPTSADARPPLVDDPSDGAGQNGADGADQGDAAGGRAVDEARPNGAPAPAGPGRRASGRSLADLLPPWARTTPADEPPTESESARKTDPAAAVEPAPEPEPVEPERVDREPVEAAAESVEPAEPEPAGAAAEPVEPAEVEQAAEPVEPEPDEHAAGSVEAEPVEAEPEPVGAAAESVEAEPAEAEAPAGGEPATGSSTVGDVPVEEPTEEPAGEPAVAAVATVAAAPASPPTGPSLVARPEVAGRADQPTPAEPPTPEPQPVPDARPTAGQPSRPSPTRLTVARVLSGVGRTLIGAGLVILLFVGYQLWGTNLQEARSQNELEDDFDATLEQLDRVDPSLLSGLRGSEETATTGAAAPTTPATVPRAVVELLAPQAGEAMAVIRIPKIRVERRVVQGTEVDDLRKGPGHYPESPLPGQRGNAAIAGHRTTYGAPFNRIDELVPGDEIQVQTVQGTAMYRVDKEPFVVSPTQVEVLNDVGDNRLTLTSCHPKLSARQRMIVTAQLVSEPFPELPSADVRVQTDIASTTTIAEAIENPDDPTASTSPTTIGEEEPATTVSRTVSTTTTTISPTTTTAADTTDTTEVAGEADLDQGLAGDRSALAPAIGWGLVAAAVALVAGLLGRAWERRAVEQPRRRRRLLVYGLVSPVFLLVLYLCFENVDRVLPAF